MDLCCIYCSSTARAALERPSSGTQAPLERHSSAARGPFERRSSGAWVSLRQTYMYPHMLLLIFSLDGILVNQCVYDIVHVLANFSCDSLRSIYNAGVFLQQSINYRWIHAEICQNAKNGSDIHASHPPQKWRVPCFIREHTSICIRTHTNIYVRIYMYICKCTCMCMDECMKVGQMELIEVE